MEIHITFQNYILTMFSQSVPGGAGGCAGMWWAGGAAETDHRHSRVLAGGTTLWFIYIGQKTLRFSTWLCSSCHSPRSTSVFQTPRAGGWADTLHISHQSSQNSVWSSDLFTCRQDAMSTPPPCWWPRPWTQSPGEGRQLPPGALGKSVD